MTIKVRTMGAWPVAGKPVSWTRSGQRQWVYLDGGGISLVQGRGVLLPTSLLTTDARTVEIGRARLGKLVLGIVNDLSLIIAEEDPAPSYMLRIVVVEDVVASCLKHGFRLSAHVGMGITRSDRKWDERELRSDDRSSHILGSVPLTFKVK